MQFMYMLFYIFCILIESLFAQPQGLVLGTLDTGDYSHINPDVPIDQRAPLARQLNEILRTTTRRRSNQDCYADANGYKYRGNTSVTQSGRTCQEWQSQTPHKHSFTSPSLFGVNSLREVFNYCRNPNNSPMGPWCYVTSTTGPKFEKCAIKKCGEEKKPESSSPVLNPSVFLEPQYETIDKVENDPFDNMPKIENTIEIAGIKVTDNVHYNVNDECIRTDTGIEYRGKKRTTASGHVCQDWNSQIPNRHPYKRAEMLGANSMREARNYCRNPNNNPMGPWCYVSTWPSTGPRFESCGLPQCGDVQSEIEQSDSGAIRYVDDWQKKDCAGPTCLPAVPPSVEVGCNKVCNQAWTCVTYEQECVARNWPHNIYSVCMEKLAVCKRRISPGKPCLAGMAQTTRWWYDHTNRRCVPFAYAGCGGNGNNFKSEQECLGKCDNWQCFLGVNVGTPTCAPGVSAKPGKRWAYHYLLKSCLEFWYFGCAGNKNRYYSKQECEAICMPKITKTSAPRPWTG